MRAAPTSIALAVLVTGTTALAQQTAVVGHGEVLFSSPPDNQITGLTTTLVVPPKHSPIGTLFLWPGLQPGGDNFKPIDNGVLQPVLSWGRSCAPGNQPTAYSTWWISAQYVNDYGKYPGYTGCHGGPIMSVASGSKLLLRMSLSGSLWAQTVTNLKNGAIVGFQIDMQRQAQNYAYFSIEPYGASPISGVTFLDTTITFKKADPLNCHIDKRGVHDHVSKPILTQNGLMCSIKKITLEYSIAPTVPDRSCRKEGKMKSTEARHPTKITFKNGRKSAIRLYWIDYAGDRKFHTIIGPDKDDTLPTYLTHPWVVTDVLDNCISLHLPSHRPSVVVVH